MRPAQYEKNEELLQKLLELETLFMIFLALQVKLLYKPLKMW